MITQPALDPDLQVAAASLPPMDLSDLAALRATATGAAAGAMPYDDVDVREVHAPGLTGAPPVSIRLLRPASAVGVALPVLVAMHGGGFVLGRASDFDYLCVEVVRRLGIAVASVDYRLAPETPYPGPLDDCVAALRYVHDAADSIGVDPDRIAVGGSSAGGGLAAGLALRARDEGGPRIAFQLLLSPAVDDRMSTPSMTDLIDPPVLAGPTRGLVWHHYLGADYSGEMTPGVPAYAVPARADDLAGLPPAYVSVMEVDPLRDSNIDYALRMLQAGVRVELHVHPGAFHGSVELVPSASSSARILDGLIDALGRGLAAS